MTTDTVSLEVLSVPIIYPYLSTTAKYISGRLDPLLTPDNAADVAKSFYSFNRYLFYD